MFPRHYSECVDTPQIGTENLYGTSEIFLSDSAKTKQKQSKNKVEACSVP
jgi:hypothetical protein